MASSEKSWERLEVEPVLYIISDKTNEHSDAKYFHIPEVNPVFVSQTLRLLAPSLHKDDICIISDMDMIPLSKDYFVNKLKIMKMINLLYFVRGQRLKTCCLYAECCQGFNLVQDIQCKQHY